MLKPEAIAKKNAKKNSERYNFDKIVDFRANFPTMVEIITHCG